MEEVLYFHFYLWHVIWRKGSSKADTQTSAVIRKANASIIWNLWRLAIDQVRDFSLRTPIGAIHGHLRWHFVQRALLSRVFQRTHEHVKWAVKHDKNMLRKRKLAVIAAAAKEGIGPPLYDVVKWFSSNPQPCFPHSPSPTETQRPTRWTHLTTCTVSSTT